MKLFFLILALIVASNGFAESVCYRVKNPSTDKIEIFSTLAEAKLLGSDKCLVELAKYVCEYKTPPLPNVMCKGRAINWEEEDVEGIHIYVLNAIISSDGGPEGQPMICSVVSRWTGIECDEGRGGGETTPGTLSPIKGGVTSSTDGLNLFSKNGQPLTSDGNGINSCSDSQCSVGDPVNVSTGLMWHPQIEFSLKTRSNLLTLDLKRTFLAQSPFPSGIFGQHWFSNFDTKLLALAVNGNTNIVWADENGSAWVFLKQQDGTFKSPSGFTGSLREYSDRYEIKNKIGTRFIFAKKINNIPDGAIISKIERHGERIDFTYENMKLTTASSKFAGRISFFYEVNGLLSKVTRERDGLSYFYTYDSRQRLKQAKDFSNKTYTYSYLSSSVDVLDSLLISEKDPLGRIISFNYDDFGRVISEVEHGNFKRHFSYEVTNDRKITTVTDVSGAKTKYFFDDKFRLVETVNAQGATEFYDWSTQNKITKIKDGMGYQSFYEYDNNRNLTLLRRPVANNPITVIYDEQYNLPLRIDLPNSTVEYTLDSTNGDVKEIQRANLFTSYEYDIFGNNIFFNNGRSSYSEPVDENGLKTVLFDIHNPEELSYDTRGRIAKRQYKSGRIITYTYDDYDHVTMVNDNSGPTFQFTYDLAGRVTQRVISGQKNREVTTYKWDERDRLSLVTDNLGRKIYYQYNSSNSTSNVIDKPSAVVAPDGQTTVFKYDILQRLVQKIEPNGAITKFEYDLRDDLIKITDAEGNYTTFSYDGNRRVIKKESPTLTTDIKGISKAARETVLYTYNDSDRLLKEVKSLNSSNSRKTITSFTYDQLDRLVSKTIQKIEANGEISDSKTSSFTYEPILETDLIKTANNEVAKLTFYHELLPPYKITRVTTSATDPLNPLGVLESDHTISRDFSGEVATLKSINGTNLFTAKYDLAGRMINVKSGDFFGVGKPVFESNMDYDEFGRKISMDNSDGYSQIRGYDQLSRLSSLVWKKGGIPEISESLTYDLAGNIVSSKRENIETIYGYDKANQLVSENSQIQSHGLSYDKVGNRIGDSNFGSATFLANAITGDKKHSRSFTTYAYDNDGLGNLTTIVSEKNKTQKDLSYNLNGKLEAFQFSTGSVGDSLLASYYYDALDRRVVKNVQVAQGQSQTSFTQAFGYLGDEEKIILARNGNGAVTLHIDGQGIDEHLGEVTSNSAKSYLTDHLGSVLNNEASSEKMAFGAFGEKLNGQAYYAFSFDKNSPAVMYGFAGREFELESGLYYNRARMYNPEIGRFFQKDPIDFGGWDVNLYRYSLNDPVNRIDPYGLDSYRTNIGHGFLVIDDPAGSGGAYVFSFWPRYDDSITLTKIMAGQPVDASAKVGFIKNGASRAFLGVEVPFSRLTQDALADQATLHRAKDFVKQTNFNGNYYSLFNIGENGFNCIGASRQVQCGNQCGGK